jgi:YD repeat-containing protein
MRVNSLIIGFLIFVSCSTHKPNVRQNDLQIQNIKGQVQNIELKNYYLNEDFKDSNFYTLSFKEITKYDTNGNLTEYRYYNSREVFESKKIYNYDFNNNLIGILFFDSLSNLTDEINYKYKYDESGKIIEHNFIDETDQITNCRYYYDKLGNVIEKKYFDIDNNLQNIEIFKYDYNGLLIETKDLNGDAEIDDKECYKYDKNGFLIEETIYDNDSEIYEVKQYILDFNGNPLKIYRFDSNKNLLVFLNYEYIYDSQGNWLEKSLVENQKKKFIKVRNITYYK